MTDKLLEEYKNSVLERMGQYCGAYILTPTGERKYASDYSVDNDAEMQKFIYFFNRS